MLKFFNRLEKTRNFVLLAFAVLMVLSLVLFYKPSDPTLGAGLTRSEETAAKVGGEYITVGELARQKEAVERGGRGGSIPARTLLNSMIGTRIARVEADRLGLTASDAEVAAYIRKEYKPTDGKPFDREAYEANAIAQEGSVSAFEERVRDGLSAQKVRAFVTSGITVSEEELVEDFKRKNVRFDLSYVSVNTADLAQTMTPTEEELRAYFDKNKAAYYISSPQKKIKYIFVNTAKIGEKLNITDEELKAEYDALPEDKKIAGVLGQEIVLRIPTPAQDGDVLSKANQIRDRLVQESQMVTETEFADVAKGQSENPVTAPNGGRLRGPVRENPNNPTDPYQRLIRMQPGQVTEPINYEGRYFLLRRGDAVPKSFEMAKTELEVSLRNRKAYTVAAELAQKVADALKQNKDVQKTVAEFAAQANMSPADMVRETAFIKPGDDVPNIGVSPQFEEGIAGLENPNDVGDKIPVQNGFAIPLLVEKKEPRDAELDEVRAQVTEAVKLEKARAQVQEIANQIAAGATNVASLAGAAASKNLKVLEAKSYSLGSPLGTGPSASTNKELEDAVYAMKEGEVTKKPINIGDSWFIVGANKRQEASMDQFAKERDRLRDDLLDRRRGEFFTDYLSATRARMEADGTIKIYDDAVAKVDAQSALPELPIDFPAQ
ncbi:MAG: peptidylprolyl isomerase [Pyrinomonadaceae bacterium]